MTTTLSAHSQRRASAGVTARRPGRIGTVAVLISGLVVAGVARVWSSSMQASAAALPYKGSGQSAAAAAPSAGQVGGMNSFVLALILGGLRGPLVMYLWSSSESQKNEKDLEDFDTKVDLIRQLQPEFDTVHIFQMWNKAYNISAQLASLPAKYAAILDAIDYGKSVNAERPNSMNILSSIGQIYAQKLGSATNDKEYYIRKVREETKYRALSPTSGGIRQKHDPILDPSDRIQAKFLAGSRPRPADLPARIMFDSEHLEEFRAAAAKSGLNVPADKIKAAGGRTTVTISEADAHKLEPVFNSSDIRYIWADWNTGSDLQYLERYAPFPYGISPIAIGYNYDKRAQVIMAETGQSPLQVSRSVIDTRPGQELRQWADEETQRAVEAEITAFVGPQGVTAANRRPQLSLPTAMLNLSQKPSDPALVTKALYHYSLAARVCRDSKSEYARHLSGPETLVNLFNDYSSHLDHLSATEYLSLGDYWYLKATTYTEGPDRSAALRKSEAAYRQAVLMYDYMNLRYYVPQQLAAPLYPPSFNRTRLEELRKVNPDSLTDLHERVMRAIRETPQAEDPNITDREEFEPYRGRAILRMRQIVAMTAATPPPTRPTTEPTTNPVATKADAATTSPATQPAQP